MSTSKILCVFCNTNAYEKILFFTEQDLEKCRSILQIRIKHGLKYADVDLPSGPSESRGYHSHCRGYFYAVMLKYLKENDQASTPSVDHVSTSADEKKCIFCEKTRVSVKRKECTLRKVRNYTPFNSFKDRLEAQATELHDEKILKKLNIYKNLKYHDHCRADYEVKFRSNIPPGPHTNWHVKRNIFKVASESLFSFIREQVLVQQKCMLLSSLLQYFKNILLNLGNKGPEIDDIESNPKLLQIIKDKITKKFGKNERLAKWVRFKKHYILCPTNVTVDDSMFQSAKTMGSINETALTLRQKINLLNNPHTSDLVSSELKIPVELIEFFTTLLCGSDLQSRQSSDKLRRVKTLCEDTIYNIWNGETENLAQDIALDMEMKDSTCGEIKLEDESL